MTSTAPPDSVQSDHGPGLPVAVRTSLPARDVLDRLEALARSGKLPGFARKGDAAFSVEIFAEPFDRTLDVRIERAGDGSTHLTPRTRVALRTPAIFVVVIALTIWPGVWLTDSMLRTYFPSYSFPTWVWYIPLTLLPLPWAARSMVRKSGVLARQSVEQQIARIIGAIDGTAVNSRRVEG